MKKTILSVAIVVSFLLITPLVSKGENKKSSPKDSTEKINPFGFLVDLDYGFHGRTKVHSDFIYKNSLIDANLSYQYNFDKIQYQATLDREYESNKLSQEYISDNKTTGHDIVAQLKLSPNKNIFKLFFQATLPNTITDQKITREGLSPWKNIIKFNKQSYNAKAGYTRILSNKENTISVNASYLKIFNNRPGEYFNNEISVGKSYGGFDPNNYKIDIVYKFTPNSSSMATVAVKSHNRWCDFDYQYDINDDELFPNKSYYTNASHREFRTIISGEYGNNITDKFNLGLGIDLEIENTIKNNSTDYQKDNKVFVLPNLNISYRFNKQHNIELNYDRSTEKAKYSLINPSLLMIDNKTIEIGNFDLKTQTDDFLSIDYNFTPKNLDLGVSLFFNNSSNYITDYVTFNKNQQLIISYANCKNIYLTGITAAFDWDIFKFLNLSAELVGQYRSSNGVFNNTNLFANHFECGGEVSLKIKPEKKTVLAVTSGYMTDQYMPQFIVNDSYYLDVSISRTFFKDMLGVKVDVTDILGSYEHTARTYSNQNFKLNHTGSDDYPMVWLELIFKLNHLLPTHISNHREAHCAKNLRRLMLGDAK